MILQQDAVRQGESLYWMQSMAQGLYNLQSHQRPVLREDGEVLSAGRFSLPRLIPIRDPYPIHLAVSRAYSKSNSTSFVFRSIICP
jgi:hypothetical protein